MTEREQEQEHHFDPPARIENLPTAYTPPQPSALNLFFGADTDVAISNFDGDEMQRWRLTAVACGPGVFGFDDQPKDGIAVKYWYAHKVEIVNPSDGEITNAIRVVLIQPDDVAFAFVSNGVAQDLRRIIQAFGAKVFNPPIRMRVDAVRTRGGFRTFKILPVT